MVICNESDYKILTEPSLRAKHTTLSLLALDEDYTEVSSEYWQEVKREIKKL